MVSIEDLKPGDKIRLIDMPNDPDPIPPGSTGTVVTIYADSMLYSKAYVDVDWDIDRSLSLIIPPDIIERVENEI